MAVKAKRRFFKNTLLFSLCLFVCLHVFAAVLHEIGFLVAKFAITLVISRAIKKSARNNASSHWTCRNESFLSIVTVIAKELTHGRGRLQ